MVTSIERKLAILNVSVVVAIAALIGIGTWVLLGQSLDREADNALDARIEAARETLDTPLSMTPGNRGPNAGQDRRNAAADTESGDSDDDHDDDDERDDLEDLEEESREILVSGDTLLFIFNADGTLVTNRRNVVLNRIPDTIGVTTALEGETNTRVVTVDGERIRVRTEPIVADDDVVGAIQAVRSEAEHDDELALVGTATLIGTGVGVLIAVPAGIYLTRRAMAPINDVLQRQRAFVSDASHELRTPLTVLRANAEVLTRTPDLSREEVEQEMRSMIGDIDDMARLVDQLLQLSRADNPDDAITIGVMSLQPAIDSAVRMLAPQAARARVDLLTTDSAIQVRSNPDLVSQILRIVIDNAIRYTPEGGRVTLSTRRDGDRAMIEVRDSGIGIQPADLPYVFDRFYRGDKARTRSTGSGLGLSIARGLVTVLGGTISIESTPGTGTLVRLTLPAVSPSPGEKQPNP